MLIEDIGVTVKEDKSVVVDFEYSGTRVEFVIKRSENHANDEGQTNGFTFDVTYRADVANELIKRKEDILNGLNETKNIDLFSALDDVPGERTPFGSMEI